MNVLKYQINKYKTVYNVPTRALQLQFSNYAADQRKTIE